MPAYRVLALTADFDSTTDDVNECREELSELESVGEPWIHDVILDVYTKLPSPSSKKIDEVL